MFRAPNGPVKYERGHASALGAKAADAIKTAIVAAKMSFRDVRMFK
jgi:hypothetical protein